LEHKYFFFFLFAIGVSNTTTSQELSGLSKKEPFTINGGLSANNVIFYSADSLSSRDPFTYVVSGNLNLTFYDIVHCPVNFTYSNYGENFSNPFNFNQFGTQPSYKWIKTYLGYNSMNFSSYTLSGHQFLGVGIEFTPNDKPFKFSAMYGRFLKAIEEDTLKTSVIPSFARYGFAFKTGYVQNGNEISIILFKAKDNINSLDHLPVKTELKPKENLALSMIIAKKIADRLMLNLEVASTAINSDTRISDSREPKHIFKATPFLFNNTVTTSYYNAYKASVKYTGESYSLGTTYEWVDPGYETLGSYYFTNDFENITLDGSKRFFKDRLNMNGRFGFQRNDLDNTKLSKSTKIVGNITGSYAASKKLNISTSYSNFTGYTYIRSNFDQINETNPYKNLDTLNFTQINQNISNTISYILGSIDNKEKQQSINFNIGVQKASAEQGNNRVPGTSFYNGNLSYSLSLIPRQLSLFSSLNVSYNSIPKVDNMVLIGPTIGGSRSMLEKKLKLLSSLSYNDDISGNTSNYVIVFRNSGNYTLHENHNFSLLFIVLNRNNNSGKRFTDFTLTLGYKYNFKTSYNEIFK